MPIDEEDRTGQFATAEDVIEAFEVVRRYRTNIKWGMEKPNIELFMQLGNLERCLALAKTVAKSRGTSE
jgi:hypothetical protein